MTALIVIGSILGYFLIGVLCSVVFLQVESGERANSGDPITSTDDLRFIVRLFFWLWPIGLGAYIGFGIKALFNRFEYWLITKVTRND